MKENSGSVGFSHKGVCEDLLWGVSGCHKLHTLIIAFMDDVRGKGALGSL